MSKFLQFPLGFDAQVDKPIDKRMVVATIAERDAIPSIYRFEGLMTYVAADQQVYVLKGGIDNTNWSELTAPSSGLSDSIFEYSGTTASQGVDKNDSPNCGTLVTIDSFNFNKMEFYFTSSGINFYLHDGATAVQEVLKLTIYGRTAGHLMTYTAPDPNDLIYSIEHHQTNVPNVVTDFGGEPSDNYFAVKELRAVQFNNKLYLMAVMNGFMNSSNIKFNVKAYQFGGNKLEIPNTNLTFGYADVIAGKLMHQTPHLIYPNL